MKLLARRLPALLVVAMTGAIASSGSNALASGHGPVFGLTTPTNGTGTWAFDFGAMGRTGESDNGTMTRAMLTYGFTEDVQLSVSAPLIFSSAPFAPSRGTVLLLIGDGTCADQCYGRSSPPGYLAPPKHAQSIGRWTCQYSGA